MSEHHKGRPPGAPYAGPGPAPVESLASAATADQQVVAIPEDYLIGHRVGNFRIEKVLGKGAMGAVYLGVHDTLARRVAIKLLQPHVAQNRTLVERFVDEARAVSSLGHPGLIQMFDFGTLPHGQFYSVMEYLDGRDLESTLRHEGRMAPERAAAIGVQIAAAVAVAHDRGIVHRDLKPANVFLVRDEEAGERVKVLDFGIAKLLDVDQTQLARTAAGHIVGTPEYMSPEQARANDHVDARADIYALGCVLYELLTGRPPFVADNIPALLIAHQQELPRPVHELTRVPSGLAAVIMRCLNKHPDARFASMRELRDALMPFAGALPEGIGTGQYGSGQSMRIPARKKGNAALAVAALAVVAVLGGIAVVLIVTGGDSTGAARPGPGQDKAQAAAGDTKATPPAVGVAETKAKAAGDSGKPSQPVEAAAAPAAEQIARGAAIWKSHCAKCHGENGEGDGKDTPPGLEPKGFADAHVAPGLLDKYRFEVIRRGVQDADDPAKPLMPAFGDKLSEAESWDVVAFIRTLAAPAPAEKDMAMTEKPALTAKLAAQGAELYRKECESCHGIKGKGDGRAAAYLERKPADLTKGVYKIRSTPRDSIPTDEDIFHTLSAGMGVGGMPSFAKLPEADRWALVAYVKTLSRRFKKEKPEDVVAIPARPAFTPEMIKRGQKAYDFAGCKNCHGEAGRGDGKDAARLEDDSGRPIRPPDFSAPFVFIGGSTPEAIYRTMMTGIAGTPMPEGALFFDADRAWDVVAYILSLQEH